MGEGTSLIWEGGEGLRGSPSFTKLKSQEMLWEKGFHGQRSWGRPL